jgi:hypothetical protein
VRRAFVIFSEGVGDTTTVPSDVAERALAAGVSVYPVVLDYHHWMVRKNDLETYLDERKKKIDDEAKRKDDRAAFLGLTPALQKLVLDMESFGKLGEMTGGNSLMNYDKVDSDTLQEILRAVIGDAQSQYLVGFVPPSSESPKQHKLEIRLAAKTSGTISSGKRTAIY